VDSSSKGKLQVYVAAEGDIDIRPAPLERDWMDATDQRYAYRCLPLAIANAYGWEILSPAGFSATWQGGAALDAVAIVPDPGEASPAISHFGYGVLTFHVPGLFRTEPGYDLLVQGPMNRPKDGLSPLAGVVETDWTPFTFTMNWAFTAPGTNVRFERGEPFCHVLPVRRGDLERFEPEVRLFDEDPELKAQYETWKESRDHFNAALGQPGSAAQAAGWQKHYHRGQNASGQKSSPKDRRTRLHLKPFRGPGRPGD
jgi:hypothetical protein